MDDKDTFRYNRDFAAALFRVKINAIQLKETVEENKKTNDQVLQDRQYQARPTLPASKRLLSSSFIFPVFHDAACPDILCFSLNSRHIHM